MGLELDYLFHPRSVAVVGASGNPQSQGHIYLKQLLEFRFSGKVYPVNPNLAELLGLQCYPNLKAIPDPVDYVISCIPASGVLSLLEDCSAKGVKVLHSYTARFGETGRPDAARLEQQVLQRTRGLGIRLIGPNCMGLYYPREGLSFKANFPREPGSVAFLSQSGGNAAELVYQASIRGIRFSKVISYGNALDLNEADFLDYLAEDPETSVIAIYIEGVKEGRRFFQVMRRASATKPVLVLHAGRTQAGRRAAASHTASLAGASVLWHTLLEQADAIQVQSMEDLIDLLVAFYFLRLGTGRRVGVVGGGGGMMVRSADECEQAGLNVIPIPEDIRQRLKGMGSSVWDWLNNPADGSILGDAGVSPPQIVRVMAEHPDFDTLIVNLGEEWVLDRPEGAGRLAESAAEFLRSAEATTKPIAFVLGSADVPEAWRWQAVSEARQRILAAGYAVYPTVSRAARSLSAFLRFQASRLER